MPDNPIYRVTFLNRGDVYEVYAREVSQGGLFGFVEVAGLEFGQKSEIVIDPSEDKLKSEFAGVERFFVPMHSVVRIDAVRTRGTSRIVKGDGDAKVSPFPVPIYSPGGEAPEWAPRTPSATFGSRGQRGGPPGLEDWPTSESGLVSLDLRAGSAVPAPTNP